MIKIAISLLVVLQFGFSADTDKKIKQQSNYLKSKDRLERRISKKLQDVANEIIKQTKDIAILKERIDNLNEIITENEKSIAQKKRNLEDLIKNNKELMAQKKELEHRIIKIIAEEFAYYLVTDKNYIDTKDAILIDEVLEKMDIILKKEFKILAKNYKKINNNISKHQQEIESIQRDLANFLKQKQRLLSLKKEREEALKRLNEKKAAYKKRLQRVEIEKKSIRATLEKLKILKKAEELEAKRQAEMQRRLKNKRLKNQKLSVRQIGSSYQTSRVKKYRGKKTIPPLDDFYVKRKFGNYTDPIYNMKIFNESVILTSKKKDAKVKSVLSGKVVFAKDTAVLDKVVIIENSGGIHTIYAHLKQIAPTIKVGKRIKKGYVIGRVDRDLTFEVTQKNYHINPLELIKVK